MTVLEKLICDLSNFATLNEKQIIKMYEEELKEAESEEEAAHNVRMRVKYMII
jgi:hypothetical protein